MIEEDSFDFARYQRLQKSERDRLQRLAAERAGLPLRWFVGTFHAPDMWLAGEEPEPMPPRMHDTPDIEVILYKDVSSAVCLEMARALERRVRQAELEKKQARESAKGASRAAKQAAEDEAQEKRVAGSANGFALRMPDAGDLKRSGRRRK